MGIIGEKSHPSLRCLLHDSGWHDAIIMSTKFPEIQGGGSLILAWQIKGKEVLVVGGGEVAYRVDQGQVKHVDRVFLPLDLEPEKKVAMVLTAIDDPDASTRIWKYCKQLKVPANIADVPSECDFYFGSVHRDGPLQIMVSTNGNGPRMAAAIRRQIGQMLPKGTGDSIKRVGQLRRKLRMVAPGKGTRDISKRMGWMSEVCDKWSTDDFNDMNDDDMERLVQYYESGIVPSFEEIRLGDRGDVVWEFDGSFGWM